MSELSIALNRFGLGARGDEPLPGSARDYLLRQVAGYDAAPATIAALPDTGTMLETYATALRERREIRQLRMEEGADAAKQKKKGIIARMRQPLLAAVSARVGNAVATPTPFPERLVHFWSNHFAISIDKPSVIGLAGPFEADAIRPHVTGRFRDLLQAAVTHPAMLLYLDQVQSIGPDSKVGAKVRDRARRARGLNENLARELMELHTLGVGSGYTQADVIELAKVLTGWTVTGLGKRDQDLPAQMRFAPAVHEPGARTILGKRYVEGGKAQLEAVLDDLARHPATARHVATKLAHHFAGDAAPPALVEALTAEFLASDGDLPRVYRVLVERPEAWAADPKFRSPWDWFVGSARAIGFEAPNVRLTSNLLDQLGQPVWKPGSPAGYADDSATWAGSDALLRRIEAADRLAVRIRDADPRALGDRLFPDALSANTAQTIARAESQTQGLALLLASPEMMRR